MNEAQPIRNVSDTALWVAIYRAMESERKDALFHDPYARRLGGQRGEAIAASMGGKSMNWPIVVRTVVLDEIVLRCVQQGAATVLNLAAGLDTRPYRLDLPSTVRWLHVDLPDMIEYFRSGMADANPTCALEFIAADLREADARRVVFERAAAHGPVLVITEGLLIYLESEQVVDLACDLRRAGTRWWLTDLASPRLLRLMERRWQPKLTAGNAPFRFGPAEGTAFFNPFGWRETEFRSTWTEALRLKRTMPLAWLWHALGLLQPGQRREAMRRMYAVVLLESEMESAIDNRELERAA